MINDDCNTSIVWHQGPVTIRTLLLGALLALSSCASMEALEPEAIESQSPADGAAAGPVSSMEELRLKASGAEALLKAPSASDGSRAARESASRSRPTINEGTGKTFNYPPPPEPIQYYGEAVSLDFEQAPLTEIVHAVMGDILGLDYVVEHPIGGEVTLRTREPIPRDQLLDILESLLKANKVLMIRDREGRFYISGSGQMQSLRPSMAGSTGGVAGYTNLIIPLEFISAANMAEILRPVAEESAFVRIDGLRNLLVLAGTRGQLAGWQDIVETFDVDLLEGMSVGVFPIENSSIEDIEDALSKLLGKDGGDGGDGMAEGLLGIGGVVRIIPMPRLSSIMAVTSNPDYLYRLAEWVERLDREPDANFEPQLYVYEAQNSSAAHLADLLSAVYGGSGGGSSRAKSGVAPGTTPEKVSGGGQGARSSAGASRKASGLAMGDMRIVADEENNALLIYATAKEYRKIKPALIQLDVAAAQVIIEATIMEVTLTDQLRYGLEWAFDGGLGNGYTGVGSLGSVPDAVTNFAGFSYSVLNSAGQIKAVLNALAQEDLLNVISSPSVMVLDNQTATIKVGNQIPIQQSSTITDGGTERFSVSYRDTGVNLTVTPSVNAGGMVTMQVQQIVTDVGPVDEEGAGERTFLDREIVSRIAVRSTESVVLGGLIRDNQSTASSGIPFLHNLPVIGPLFGTKGKTGDRTELLVMITPRVMYNDSELREVGREMRHHMRELELIDPELRPTFLVD